MIAFAPLCLLAASIVLLADPTSISRWSQTQPSVGEIVRVTDQGVEVRKAQDLLPETIAWFDIRQIDPELPDIRAHRETMDTAWRAHARLARGDDRGAFDLYMRLAPAYLWARGVQSADVSLGLARCLIDRGDRVRAVTPALSWFVASGMHAPGVPLPAGTADGSVDPQYGVLIDLPPVFVHADRLAAVDPLPDSSLITAREKLLHAYFTLACTEMDDAGIAGVLEQIEGLRRQPGARDAGVELFEDMVLARAHPDPEQRAAARKALDRRARVNTGTWVEVWARLGLGAAMIEDDDTRTRELGVIELIHIIVRLPAVCPALTPLAARLAHDELTRTNRAAWAAQLMLDAHGAGQTQTTLSPTQEHDTND